MLRKLFSLSPTSLTWKEGGAFASHLNIVWVAFEHLIFPEHYVFPQSMRTMSSYVFGYETSVFDSILMAWSGTSPNSVDFPLGFISRIWTIL